ncbi:MAG: PKD domain-containing protein, partial [Bacteroidota bacterium]
MQKPATILISLFLLWAGLTPVQGQQPTATFSANNTQGCPPLTVAFQNNSANAGAYFWDFGNGNTSTLAQPVNSYTTPGNYTVTLIASDNNGQADTLVIPQFVTVHTPPSAALAVVNASACANGTAIQFQNNSTNANTYTWNFGDGSTSSQVNPQHQYAQSGTFSVSLIASSAQGCTDVAVATQAVTIHPQPDPGFTADTTTVCDSTYTIQFQAIDLQAVQWNWTFGDGTTGTGASPAHAYGDTGSYPVALTVVNAVGCSDSLDIPGFITLNAPFTPDFAVADPQGCAPLATAFSYTNSGISQASWSFGDGTASSAHSPQKTYTTPGHYSVALELTDAQGCTFRDTVPNLVQVLDTPVVAFQAATTSGCVPLDVTFSDGTTVGDPATSWTWNFGDG